MLRRRGGISLLGGLLVFGAITAAGAADTSFIAGTTPDERPADAPVIREFVKAPGWAAESAFGVIEPWPPSIVALLRDQGGWYTPFSRPGMIGPYDIRGLHDRPVRLAQFDEPAMQVIATTPGWVCTRWLLAVPTISGAEVQNGAGAPTVARRWICTQRSFLGPAASQIRPPDAVRRQSP